MQIRGVRILANGTNTEHPVPGLPFVDDSHVPTDTGEALEAVGRNQADDMWGRVDQCRRVDGDEYVDLGWKAFTTDPLRRDLAWLVRYHPKHGRSVWLVEDEYVTDLYAELDNEILLWRRGGYWWDGTNWYRPQQLFDMSTEAYVRRPVPDAAATRPIATPKAGSNESDLTLNINDINLSETLVLDTPAWEPHLAAWTARRLAAGEPPDQSVVDITAPELGAAQLLNLNQMATLAGISAGTLRGYLSRGENNIPEPQALIGTRPVWSRPVVEEWIEARAYAPEVTEKSVSSQVFGEHDQPQGIADVWEKVYYWFLNRLSSDPQTRPRLGLRWRNRGAIQHVAKDLSWQVAVSLPQLVPTKTLILVMRDALLHDLTESAQLQAGDGETDDRFYGLSPYNGSMLDWLIRHDPLAGRRAVQEVIYAVEHNQDLYRTNRDNLKLMFTQALNLNGKLTGEQVNEFITSTIVDLNRSGDQ